MEKLIRKRYVVVGISFVLCALISAFVTMVHSMKLRRGSLERAGFAVSSQISKLQYVIDSRILNTKILRMIIVDGNGMINDFYGIAEKLYLDDSSIRSIQLAPKGVVKYVYPLEDDDTFAEFIQDKIENKQMKNVKDPDKITITGLLDFPTGEAGIIAKTPIYIKKDTGENVFWGYSILALSVQELFDKADLDCLESQGYDYRIWRMNPDTLKRQTFVENIKGELKNPIEADIKIPNGNWTMSVTRKGGWLSKEIVEMDAFIGFLFSILVSVIIYGFLIVNKQKKEMAVLANTDPLTGLNNERYFAYCVIKQVYESDPFGLFYLDVNKFKQVNDQYGHDVGDKLLIEVASRIQYCIGDSNKAFRIGGDEFAVLVYGNKTNEFYYYLKKKIKKELRKPIQINSYTLYSHASCGYARYPEDQDNVEDLIKEADKRMYMEKNENG
jgi:diguanylate cyclase (GGDEF)-like protein